MHILCTVHLQYTLAHIVCMYLDYQWFATSISREGSDNMCTHYIYVSGTVHAYTCNLWILDLNSLSFRFLCYMYVIKRDWMYSLAQGSINPAREVHVQYQSIKGDIFVLFRSVKTPLGTFCLLFNFRSARMRKNIAINLLGVFCRRGKA